MSESAFDTLLKMMKENPEEFSLNQFTLTHCPSQVQVWIGNGRSYYAFFQPRMRFTFWQRRRFCRAFKEWKNAHITQKLIGEER